MTCQIKEQRLLIFQGSVSSFYRFPTTKLLVKLLFGNTFSKLKPLKRAFKANQYRSDHIQG